MQTIDIRTTQNVTIEYELATLRERMLAFVVDLLIVSAMYLALFFALLGSFGSAFLDSGMLAYFIFILLPIVGFMTYQFLSEALANGQSWGKRALGIKVVRVDGLEPGLSDYFFTSGFFYWWNVFCLLVF